MLLACLKVVVSVARYPDRIAKTADVPAGQMTSTPAGVPRPTCMAEGEQTVMYSDL